MYLSHRINGKTYTTVYAHMNSRSVSNGQTVKQGDQLGFMGNTGQSYGQHLHFELHLGEWNVGKTNAVDPSPDYKNLGAYRGFYLHFTQYRHST